MEMVAMYLVWPKCTGFNLALGVKLDKIPSVQLLRPGQCWQPGL